MLIVGAVIVIVEALEHILIGESVLNYHFLTEVIIYGVGVPALAILLLSTLDRVEVERSQVEYELGSLNEFMNRLKTATTWDELTKNIVQFPKFVLPVVRSCLLIHNPDKAELDPVATWVIDGERELVSTDKISTADCCSCTQASEVLNAGLSQCENIAIFEQDNNFIRYCLPLVYRNFEAGKLIFDIPTHEPVSSKQLDVVENLAPEIALAVDNARLNSLVNDNLDAATVERERIARDLHDTLGQNISYLRLKLDQVSVQNPLLGIKELQDELEGMRVVADEAYEQMRGTLAELHPDSQVRLEQALRSQVDSRSIRAGFAVQWHVTGTPRAFRPHTNRQILYICREVLNNIEKHAHAKQVVINLLWGEADLALTITDDGNGFNPQTSQHRQNLGMTIMAERAHDINCQLRFDSEPGQGSTVSLQVPYSTKP